MMYGYPGLDSEEWMKWFSQANKNILTAEQRKSMVEDLKDQIDLALARRDKQWFMELTDKLKEYEVWRNGSLSH